MSDAPLHRFNYWDPTATRAWLVFRDGTSYCMHEDVDREEPGHWQVSAPAGEGAVYAFVADWVQELRYSENSQRFGIPHLEAKGVGLVPPDLPKPPDIASATKEEREPATEECEHPTVAEVAEAVEPSLAERLGEAEFLLEPDILLQTLVSEGSGTRLNLYVAPRVIMLHAEVLSSDSSWGPVPFYHTPSDEEIESQGTIPSAWTADAVDFYAGGSELILRLRKRDWRADPFALELRRETDDGWKGVLAAADTNDAKDVPPQGPIIWSSIVSSPPRQPPFCRSSDRDLVIYELHIGSFTPEGTLLSATEKLWHIQELGCTAISVMPVQQCARRLHNSACDFWGYDVLSFMAIDTVYGYLRDLTAFVEAAHGLGLAVLIDFVVNHLMWGADVVFGRQLFLQGQDTDWGPRPDFSKQAVRSYVMAAAKFILLNLGVDGLRVDSTKSLRKLPSGGPDAFGAGLLSELATMCRSHGRLVIAEDLEDGDGVLQWGGLGFHFQWDMAMFCWVYDALVHPLDEFRDLSRVVKGLIGLAPGRGHALRGRVIFMESHDTAASDRYGRIPAAVHHGKSFMAECGEQGEGGDAFQKVGGALPYPEDADVTANLFAASRAALGLVLMMTAPGIPMLLQGQEVCDSRPFKWPQGPAIEWAMVDAPDVQVANWRQLCQDLIALRLGKSYSSPADGFGPTLTPLQGDGMHVFQASSGVLAYLRWAEAEDSRDANYVQPRLALVAINFTNNSFNSHQFGVPPSWTWRFALSTADSSVSKSSAELQVLQNTPSHGFSCSINVALQAYSAVILLQHS